MQLVMQVYVGGDAQDVWPDTRHARVQDQQAQAVPGLEHQQGPHPPDSPDTTCTCSQSLLSGNTLLLNQNYL